jgi:hypothetical protein
MLNILFQYLRIRGAASVAITLLLFSGGLAQAEEPPTAPGGSTFQISETIWSSGDTGPDPEIATDVAGNFVVVWSAYTQGEYSYPYGYQLDDNVFLRRFDVNAAARGDEILVKTQAATNALVNPVVDMDSDGDFVVVWQSDLSSGYTYSIHVKGQRYDQNGDAAGIEFPIDSGSGLQRSPNVAMAPGGNFTVVWEGIFNQLNDFDAFAQRFDSAGVAQGTNFSVSSDLGNLNGLRDNPAIGMDAGGNFVVVWHKQDYGNYTEKTILARRFASDGVAVGDEFEIGTSTGGYSAHFTDALEVASDSSGNFVVVWEGYDASAYPGVTRVMARRYDNTGTAQGAAFQVNTSKESYGYPVHEKRPEVVWDTAGGFVIVWDTSYDKVYGRRFEPGAAPSAEFRVDEPMSLSFVGARNPAVAAMPDGEFVVAWQGPVGEYGNNYILGRTLDAVPEPRGWIGHLAALATLLLLEARSAGKRARVAAPL